MTQIEIPENVEVLWGGTFRAMFPHFLLVILHTKVNRTGNIGTLLYGTALESVFFVIFGRYSDSFDHHHSHLHRFT